MHEALGEEASLLTELTLNDEHSALNVTRVRRIVRPTSLQALQSAIRGAHREGAAVSVAGSRHAMGGQQFGSDTVHIDMRGMNRLLVLDSARGVAEVEAGIEWHEVIEALARVQPDPVDAWGIRQKQTGSDRLSVGGAVASNVHGRGLTQGPIVADVEGFTLVDATGEVVEVDRERRPDLFALVTGGYGLFGIAASVRLRLNRRHVLRRDVELVDTADLIDAFEARIADGYTFGDCQFSIDRRSDAFLSEGILSCYRPEPGLTSVPSGQRALTPADWQRLLYLTHADPAAAAKAYVQHYVATSGQLYWSDLHQQSEYVGRYHPLLDQALGARVPGSEIITEIYVPRSTLAAFMADAAEELRDAAAPVVYGTIRLVERDDETLLAWARERWACIIFNLHVDHEPTRLAAAASEFRALIDLGISHGGSYYLTYHRFASREQLLACHPRFPEFLAAKLAHDPDERFQSEWYRHYRGVLGFDAGPGRARTAPPRATG